MSSQKRGLEGARDEFREIVAQLAQLELGDDEGLLDEAGQWVDESGSHRVGLAQALGRCALGDTSWKLPPESRALPA